MIVAILATACAFISPSLLLDGKFQPHDGGFEKYSYFDEGLGMEAFTMLLPKGWKAEGGINWSFANPSMPASARFKFFNPQGLEQMEILPSRTFSWVNSPHFTAFFREGSKYLYWEARRPMSAVDYLQKIVVSRDRDEAKSLRIVKTEQLPDLPEQLGMEKWSIPWSETDLDGGLVLIEYDLGGRPVREELYAVVRTIATRMPVLGGEATSVVWFTDFQFCFRAPRGELDSIRPVFEKMAKSMKINPLWRAEYNNLIYRASQYRFWYKNYYSNCQKFLSNGKGVR